MKAKFSTVDKIEQKLGFQLPSEITKLYETTEKVDAVANYFFDLRQTHTHWLLDCCYFLLKPEDMNSENRGRCSIDPFFAEFGKNTLESVNETVSKSIEEHWSERKIFVFGWSNEVVEKDTSLVYLFDEFGTSKGIYVHSLNFVEEKIRLANSLSDIFQLDLINTLHGPKEFYFEKVISDEQSDYKTVLKGQYRIVELESVDDINDYQALLSELSRLARNKFIPIVTSSRASRCELEVEVSIGKKRYHFTINHNSDYVDLRIIEFINKCLADSGFTRKLFLIFTTAEFGQEVGIAFLSKKSGKTLSEMKHIEIVKI